MPIKVTCTNCGGVLHAPDDAAGKRGRCPTCGTVLTISGDAPRVAGSAAIPPPAASGPLDAASRPISAPAPAPAPRTIPGPGPGLTEASAGIPIGPRPVGDADAARASAFPRPPAAGQSMATGGNRMPPAGAKFSDPFMKPGRTADAIDADAAVRGWAKARRGLGWVQAGVVFLFIAAVACPLIELAGQFGAALPDRDPGFAGVEGFSSANEIRAGATLVPAVLGFLFVVVGRLGFAGAPRSSHGSGIAAAAAWATLIAFLGLLTTIAVTGLVTANGSPPRVIPHKDVLRPELRMQERAERYVAHLFTHPDEAPGQAQRLGTLTLVVFALVAELWFLNALGRYAAALQSPPAARRVTGFLVLLGGLFALGVIGLLAYDLFGQGWVNSQVRPKWNDLGDQGRAAVVGGGLAVLALVLAVLYYRMLGGVKRAIREAFDAMPA